MSALSATSVQKTLKEETTSLFARLAGAGAAAPTVVTTNGLSKGLVPTLTRTGVGDYTLTLENSCPVNTYLGTILSIGIEDSTGAIINHRIIATSASARTIRFLMLGAAGSPTDAPIGSFLNCTITYTPSKVF